MAKKFDAKANQYFGYLPRQRFAIRPVPPARPVALSRSRTRSSVIFSPVGPWKSSPAFFLPSISSLAMRASFCITRQR